MVTIHITKELDELWAMDEDFAKMTDEEIISLVMEDSCEWLNNASWKIER